MEYKVLPMLRSEGGTTMTAPGWPVNRIRARVKSCLACIEGKPCIQAADDRAMLALYRAAVDCAEIVSELADCNGSGCEGGRHGYDPMRKHSSDCDTYRAEQFADALKACEAIT